MPINPSILSAWESLEKSCGVPDILFDHTTVLLILESPHTQEVEARTPAVGRSGKDMTKVLFNGEVSVSMGEYLSSRSSHVGICNISSLPLQAHAYTFDCKNEHQPIINALAALRGNWDKPHNMVSVLKAVEDIMFAKFLKKLNDHPHAKVLVPCGKFAQHYVRRAANFTIGREIIWGIPHPSHGWWDVKSSFVRRSILKHFEQQPITV